MNLIVTFEKWLVVVIGPIVGGIVIAMYIVELYELIRMARRYLNAKTLEVYRRLDKESP